MSDAALQNAEARRDALAAQINAAQQQIDEWKRDLRDVEQFIATWHAYAGMPKKEGDASEGSLLKDVILEKLRTLPPKTIVQTASSRRSQGNSKKEEVAEAARDIIRERGEPVGRSDLYKELVARGLRIEGTDPEMVLSTMLWRMKDRVARLKSGGYWLADVKNDEVGYDPNPPETEAEFQVRMAAEYPDLDGGGRIIQD
ncbi:hypothetical protein [Pinisolibacter sp.]|uniref:hypothetical protein n=1 Tax=Pinisolibacter sp. TaxID=2172024 RepID=UPI002FDD309C